MPLHVYGRVRTAADQVDLVGLAPTMRAFMRANVASSALVFVDPHVPARTSRPGCVIASPSWTGVTDQDYVHHWVRDAAITAIELAAAPAPGADGVDRTLCDYVAFSQTCQDNAPYGHFFRAAFHIDGTARDWSDQKDGPSLQGVAFAAAWPYLDAAARTTARAVAQRGLDETVRAWSDDTGVVGPWEDVFGSSFFARAAQIRFLGEVATTNALGLTPPGGLATALDGLRAALATHWHDDLGCYVSIPGGTPGSPTTDVSGYDPNADVIMACLYGSMACTDPKLLATAAKLRAAYDVGGTHEYRINVDDRGRGLGPMIGRYPSDTYDGDVEEQPNHGHPWAICTANLAELHYRLACAYRDGDGPAFDDLTGPFLAQSDLGAATVAAGGPPVVDALVATGDRMLRAVVSHSDHQHLSEQFDEVTGFEKSVQDLTWSYAAYLSAVRARPA